MIVSTPPERYVDETDSHPIEVIEPDGSVFSEINIKRLDDGVEVRAKREGVGDVIEFTANLTEEMYRGIAIDQEPDEWHGEEDLKKALNLVGYALIDKEVKQY